MGNITLELDSNFVAPSSRVRDEQQTKKMRVFDREQKFDENDTHTHTKVIRHHHHHGRPKRGTWPSTKKKKNFTSQSIWQKIERMTLLFRFDAYNSHILVNKKKRERDGQGERERERELL